MKIPSCRNCDTPMELKTYHGIEYDECPTCNALWFDAGEFQLILQDTNLKLHSQDWHKNLSLPTTCRHCETPQQTGDIKCRHCRKALGYLCPRDQRPLLIAKLETIEVDLCPTCHGVWFDGDEFNTLIEALQQKNQKPTPATTALKDAS